jgi:hypothetical protein
MPYTLTIDFDEAQGREDVFGWFKTIADELPDNATATITRATEVVFAEALKEEHIGATVKFTNTDGGEVTGTLEHVFPAGRHGVSRTLVVNGTAYTTTFGLVTVT